MTLYTNMSPKKTIRNALLTHAQNITNLNIASAFFDANEDILEIAKRGINVNLVVRLDQGTSLQSLKLLMNKNKISIRYYTDRKFHPKIYIFGDRLALIGSANATKAGINSNSEVSVVIEQNSEDFDDLVVLFSSYWDSAVPLTEETIKRVEHLFKGNSSQENSGDSDIANALGGAVSPPSEIVVSNIKKSKQKIYLEDYERRYQYFKSSYDQVHDIYFKLGKRKPVSQELPLRIEIDQFWNYIRKTFTSGNSYNNEPIRHGEHLEKFILTNIESWLIADFPYLAKVVEKYWTINENFGSVESIQNLTPEETFDTLMICHAFRENMRYLGTWDVAKKSFGLDVEEKSLKNMICYLLHDKRDRFTHRMADCIFGPYKVDHIERSGIQELLGWVNNEGIPICNKRTLMALRYLGAIEGKF